MHLTIAGERLETTPEHAFYVEGRGWVAAGGLKVGDHIRRADGTHGVVETIAFEQRPQVMYNLTVDRAHSFFVGEGRWLVHNRCDTSREARRLAMREQGIPTSAQPVAQFIGRQGRAYVYVVPSPGGGSRSMVVNHQIDVRHGRHWEAGVARVDDAGNAVLNRHGIPQYLNVDPLTGIRKSRISYGP